MIENLQEDRSYYVYRHLRGSKVQDEKTGTPFYIGMGHKNPKHKPKLSDEYERAYTVTSRNKFWKLIFKKYGRKVEILCDNLTREEAFSKEIEFIKLYGRKNNDTGILCNLTDGGEHHLGVKRTPESIAQSVATNRVRHNCGKGRIASEESRRKLSETKKANPFKWTDEMRAKLSSRMSGKTLPPEWRKAIGDGNRGKKLPEELKAKLKKAFSKRCRPLVCLQTGILFDSAEEAAKAMFPHKQVYAAKKLIGLVCRKHYGNNTVYGYTFEYV